MTAKKGPMVTRSRQGSGQRWPAFLSMPTKLRC